ncbi:hypothetical protein [Corallococcus carmarthensis]|uniref:hypothetical protein n=1 Tax=Corallococcus carmarthensis TaxID=2316728 RepID=UPI00148DF057|nr:hypothetical protein [Corallococcus carmarthensis]NOK17295.1 hypothetical protein [Corallococcus carmarthensis]
MSQTSETGSVTGSATVSSSLMYNYLAATSVDAAYPLASAEDTGGSPLLFSVGASAANTARKTLWVMLRDTTVTTGWRQVELSPDANHDVQGYAVVQAPSGQVIIAVALDDGAGGSRVFVSPALLPTPDGGPWNTLNTAWVQRNGAPAGMPVQRLLLGDFVSASEAPLLVAEVKNTSGTTGRYFVDASTSTTGSAWVNWAPPKDMQTLHDVVVARASITGISYRGTWSLFDDNTGKRCLTFTSLLDPSTNTTHSLSVTAPPGARCLWALEDRQNQGLSALYVGGDGLAWFPSTGLKNAKSTALTVASSDVLSGVTTVLAQQDASRVSVWAVDGSQRLFSLNNAVGATEGWSAPLQQREHVARLAPRRNQKRSTGELFVTSTDNSLITYLWQDPDTTAWQNTDMVLPTLANGQEFPSYTTVVRFTDAQGAVLVGQTVQVNASEWSRVMVNGYWTDLDASTKVEVKTDSNGTVTLINKVSDVGTPVFRFSAAFLAQDVTADPSAELRANLAAKLKGQDLSQWKKPDGTPVVPPGADPDLVAQVQASLQQLMDHMDSLPADGSAAPVEEDTAPAPTAMAKTQTSFKVLGNVTNAIETAAGDVLQALKSAAGAVYEYVIQPIVSGTKTLLQFFVKIGEQVVSFVVRTIKEALQLISWLFQQLAVLIEDIIQFLGFLFAWDDILATQRVMEAMTKDVVLALAGNMKGMEASITQYFDGLIAKWDGVCQTALGMPDVTTQQVVTQTQAAQTPEQQSANDCLTTSPGATFSTYQVSHGGIGDSTAEESDAPVAQAITDFLQTVGNILSDVADSVKELCQGLQTMVQQGTVSLHSLVQLLAGEAAKTLLAAARDLLVGLCEVIADVSQAILDDVLLRPFNIPVLSWLYKKLTGEDSLTMLGALSLLAAIPVTIVFKLLTGEAPVPEQAGAQQKQSRSMKALTPWRTTSLVALPESKEDNGDNVIGDAAHNYSVIGGALSIVSSFFYTGFLTAGQLTKSEVSQRWFSTGQTVSTWTGVAGSFPFDADVPSQQLDRMLWALYSLEAVVTGLVSLLSWTRGADVKAKGLAKALEVTDSTLLTFMGLVSLVLSLVSYILELDGEIDPSVPYHSTFWDSEKFGSNVLAFGGMTGEGVAGLIPGEADKALILAGAAIAEWGALALDVTRWADAVLYNNTGDGTDKKLFQLW